MSALPAPDESCGRLRGGEPGFVLEMLPYPSWHAVSALLPARKEPPFARELPNIPSYPQGYDVARLGTFPPMPGAAGDRRAPPDGRALPCRARIHDRGGDLRLLVTAWRCQAATWYSCVSPPRTCFRRIRYSARLICGGRL